MNPENFCYCPEHLAGSNHFAAIYRCMQLGAMASSAAEHTNSMYGARVHRVVTLCQIFAVVRHGGDEVVMSHVVVRITRQPLPLDLQLCLKRDGLPVLWRTCAMDDAGIYHGVEMNAYSKQV